MVLTHEMRTTAASRSREYRLFPLVKTEHDLTLLHPLGSLVVF